MSHITIFICLIRLFQLQFRWYLSPLHYPVRICKKSKLLRNGEKRREVNLREISPARPRVCSIKPLYLHKIYLHIYVSAVPLIAAIIVYIITIETLKRTLLSIITHAVISYSQLLSPAESIWGPIVQPTTQYPQFAIFLILHT